MAGNQPDSKLKVVSPVFNIIREKIIIFLAILFILAVAGLIVLASFFDLGDKTFERTISEIY